MQEEQKDGIQRLEAHGESLGKDVQWALLDLAIFKHLYPVDPNTGNHTADTQEHSSLIHQIRLYLYKKGVYRFDYVQLVDNGCYVCRRKALKHRKKLVKFGGEVGFHCIEHAIDFHETTPELEHCCCPSYDPSKDYNWRDGVSFSTDKLLFSVIDDRYIHFYLPVVVTNPQSQL